jgi:hypothetical protein
LRIAPSAKANIRFRTVEEIRGSRLGVPHQQ